MKAFVPTRPPMFKYAILFFIVALIAGGFGLTNLSAFARRISMALFAIFFLGFLALLGFAYLLGEAFDAGRHSMLAPLFTFGLHV
jgi:uncharacterized membrane protein YtjA (UPF0391 family)